MSMPLFELQHTLILPRKRVLSLLHHNHSSFSCAVISALPLFVLSSHLICFILPKYSCKFVIINTESRKNCISNLHHTHLFWNPWLQDLVVVSWAFDLLLTRLNRITKSSSAFIIAMNTTCMNKNYNIEWWQQGQTVYSSQ